MLDWINLGVIKRGVLAFWATWLSIVTLTNILDALKVLGILPPSWAWTSGNFSWIEQTMQPLRVPTAVEAVLFGGVIVWELLSAVLYWRATASFRNRELVHERAALLACGVNLALWCAFQVLDEVFLAFQPEGVHRVIFANQILTILLLQLLPAGSTPAET